MAARHRALLLAGALLAAAGCADGDWLGPGERWLRGAVDGWDMWATEAVRPYEPPQPGRVEGTVPVDPGRGIAAGRAALERLEPGERARRRALTYRRYCHHCHGPNGDGRIIVGESLDLEPADLRGVAVQGQTDDQLLGHLRTGGMLMLPLATTMSPAEMLLAIEALRALQGRPSEPYFDRRNTAPLR